MQILLFDVLFATNVTLYDAMFPVVSFERVPSQSHVKIASGFPPVTVHINLISFPRTIPPGGICCILGASFGGSEMGNVYINTMHSYLLIFTCFDVLSNSSFRNMKLNVFVLNLIYRK